MLFKEEDVVSESLLKYNDLDKYQDGKFLLTRYASLFDRVNTVKNMLEVKEDEVLICVILEDKVVEWMFYENGKYISDVTENGTKYVSLKTFMEWYRKSFLLPASEDEVKHIVYLCKNMHVPNGRNENLQQYLQEIFKFKDLFNSKELANFIKSANFWYGSFLGDLKNISLDVLTK